MYNKQDKYKARFVDAQHGQVFQCDSDIHIIIYVVNDILASFAGFCLTNRKKNSKIKTS